VSGVDFKELNRLLKSFPYMSKRELFTLVALHALLSIPPSQRPPNAVEAAVQAADKALKRLKETN
jgi:hypothetical protein